MTTAVTSKASPGTISTFAEFYSALQKTQKSRVSLCDSTFFSYLHKFSPPQFSSSKFSCQTNTTHIWPRLHQPQPHPDPDSLGFNAGWGPPGQPRPSSLFKHICSELVFQKPVTVLGVLTSLLLILSRPITACIHTSC